MVNQNKSNQLELAQKSWTADEIEEWITSYLAELLKIEAEEIDETIPFERYGLDSAAIVGLTGDLEEWLGIQIEPTLIYDYSTIIALSQYLAEKLS